MNSCFLKSFVSLAPYYVDFKGHNIHYQTSLHAAAKHLGMEYVCLLPPLKDIEELPFLGKSFFRAPTLWSFFRGTLSLFRHKKAQPSLYFLESFGIKDLFMLSLALFFMQKTDHYALLFRRGLGHRPVKKLALQIGLRLVRQHRGLILLTDSDIIAKQLDCQVVPIPHTDCLYEPSLKGEKIRCYWPGAPRPAKGLQELKALSAVIDQNKFELIAAKSSNLKNTTLVSDYLDKKTYFNHLKEADIILLPYDPQVYAEGTSGILVEAICLGKIPLVKEGSYLAYELRKFGLKKLILDWQPKQVFKVIEHLLEDHEVKERLEIMRLSYRQFHNQTHFNTTLEKFITRHQTPSTC